MVYIVPRFLTEPGCIYWMSCVRVQGEVTTGVVTSCFTRSRKMRHSLAKLEKLHNQQVPLAIVSIISTFVVVQQLTGAMNSTETYQFLSVEVFVHLMELIVVIVSLALLFYSFVRSRNVIFSVQDELKVITILLTKEQEDDYLFRLYEQESEGVPVKEILDSFEKHDVKKRYLEYLLQELETSHKLRDSGNLSKIDMELHQKKIEIIRSLPSFECPPRKFSIKHAPPVGPSPSVVSD